MCLLTKTVPVTVGKFLTYYENLGYKIPKRKDSVGIIRVERGTKIEVNVKDLPEGSNVRVRCICEGCNTEFNVKYNNYIKSKNNYGDYYCGKCINRLYVSKNSLATRLNNGKSFYDWCKEQECYTPLKMWDYDLNNCSPKDICYGSSKKFWFKCLRHPEHKSELKSINSFTNGHEGVMDCKQCNSLAQWFVDNKLDIDKYWDKEKNINVNPWKISKSSGKKIWIKCQEKDYHGSYETTVSGFTSGRRCPYCSNNSGKVHPKDSFGQYIIDNYGEDFLHKIWSDKNNTSPFEYTPYSSKKVWFRCLDGNHEDFLRTCAGSYNCEFRCPKCVEDMKNSIIEEKVKKYLKELNYEVLTEYNCSIKPVNPKTKNILPYDNEIELVNNKRLIIEVHGDQHYRSAFYKTMHKCSDEEAEKMLKQRKLYDRYKKAYAEHYGYEYLEIPYTAFRGKNKELYKQMIDNKIEEILHNTKAS